VNAAGEAFVTGNTGSGDFPTTPTAFDKTYAGGDAFVMRINAAGSALIYSSYYGGSMGEAACGIAVNSSNEAFISGYTETDNGTFPITSCAFQPVFGGQSTANIRGDIYVAKVDASGSTLQYSTFVGGNSDDYQIPRIVLFGACEEEVIVNGTSHSANFPTTPGVFQPTKLNGGQDQHIVFKMKPKVNAHFTYTKPPCSTTVTFADSSYGNCVWQSGAWTPGSWTWYFGDGTTSAQQNPVHTYTTLGTYTVSLVVSCPKDSVSMIVNVTNSSQPVTGNTTLCSGGTTVLNAGTANSYSWNTGATTSSISVSPSATTSYSVIVNNGGCQDTIYMNVVVSPGVALSYSVTPITCNGSNNGASAISVSGGTPPYNYLWSSGATTASISD
jgi:PKD repeat protein